MPSSFSSKGNSEIVISSFDILKCVENICPFSEEKKEVTTL